jgi:UDP-N-acetylmuramyl pentapeptide phosphotransferase/UDP-N-acetylglucosamine-1-phosphate transferase
VVLGMVDDVKNLSAGFKLVVQVAAASIAASGGNMIHYLSAPGSSSRAVIWIWASGPCR